MKYLGTTRMQHVERQAQLVAVQIVEHTARVRARPGSVCRANIVHGVLELDADDLGAEVGENARAGRARDNPGKIYDTNAFKSVLTHTDYSPNLLNNYGIL